MDKLIVTAALTGNITLPTQTPYLPISPEQIAEEAVKCVSAGAASIHVHARDPRTGQPSSDPELYRAVATLIKARTNAIFVPTTGGTMTMTPQERLRVVPGLKPEMATCNLGSINFSIHPIVDRYKEGEWKNAWEKDFAAGTKDFIFRNTFGDIEIFYKTMLENGTKPEFEAYDVGHLYNLSFFLRRGIIKAPVWIQFVTGILGGIGSDLENILFMKNTADRLIGAQNYKFSVIGAGYPAEFYADCLSMMMGGHVRVGLEDNLFVSKGVLAKGSWELVEKVVRLARELGREIATPDEARQILGLKGKDQVNF
ncbi:MAG TPA: 3-keto-5-aminohexanoate cleavage protein [Dehalococcoidales bacterium]|nr:3-keto-5-aminohexanoate cleavage protein [Dehalococcoidales bacterium]